MVWDSSVSSSTGAKTYRTYSRLLGFYQDFAQFTYRINSRLFLLGSLIQRISPYSYPSETLPNESNNTRTVDWSEFETPNTGAAAL